jgi:hypothetical protein
MSWRLVVTIAAILLLPFATAQPHYVLAQYHDCWTKLRVSSQPDRAFSDLRGLFWSVGCVIPMSIFFYMQVIAAAATLGLSFVVIKRWREPHASAFVLTLAVCYLMLFNPRTEGNSYVILTPMIALPAALLFVDGRHRRTAWILVLLAIWLTGNLWAYWQTLHWMKPLACIIFIILMLRELLRGSVADWPAPAVEA